MHDCLKKKFETTVDTLTGLWFFDLLGSFFYISNILNHLIMHDYLKKKKIETTVDTLTGL